MVYLTLPFATVQQALAAAQQTGQFVIRHSDIQGTHDSNARESMAKHVVVTRVQQPLSMEGMVSHCIWEQAAASAGSRLQAVALPEGTEQSKDVGNVEIWRSVLRRTLAAGITLKPLNPKTLNFRASQGFAGSGLAG